MGRGGRGADRQISALNGRRKPLKILDRLPERLKNLSRLAQIWWGLGAFLVLGVAVFSTLAPDSCFSVLFVVWLVIGTFFLIAAFCMMWGTSVPMIAPGLNP